ncbi:hypothetical protein D3C80_1619660 [compost metagenome]
MECPFIFRTVIVGALIKHCRHLAQHIETVRKTGGNPERHGRIGIEMLPHPLPTGRTIPTQIHRHVEDGARNDLHQLALWPYDLVVQTTQRTLAGTAQVILHEIHLTTTGGKILLTKQLHKAATLIGIQSMLD